MITLNQSGVVFDSEHHRYFLNGIELFGITDMMSRRLFPNMYDGVPKVNLNTAAMRGSFIHESIDLFDNGFPPSETIPELENYKRIKNDNHLKTINNEYIVTDGCHFASAVDVVFEDEKGEIILADIKTTSKLHKDYVAWQLSMYKFLFELQNPTLKVSCGYAIWLRGEKYKFEPILFVPEDNVKKLLTDEINDIPVHTTETFVPTEIKDCERAVYQLTTQIKTLTEQKKELSEGLLKLMRDNGVKTYKGEYITLSRTAATTREDIDKAKLKKDFPEAYAACVKVTNIGEKLQIR